MSDAECGGLLAVGHNRDAHRFVAVRGVVVVEVVLHAGQRFVAAADVGVLPAHFEGLPRVFQTGGERTRFFDGTSRQGLSSSSSFLKKWLKIWI